MARLQRGRSSGWWGSSAVSPSLSWPACAQPAPPSDPPPRIVATQKPEPITAVLAAGDASIPVFDHAIDYLRDLLADRNVEGSQTWLLSAQRERPPGEELSRCRRSKRGCKWRNRRRAAAAWFF
ncbi:MAG: hypothetical protein WDN69_18615 [Aliidongia sp.]